MFNIKSWFPFLIFYIFKNQIHIKRYKKSRIFKKYSVLFSICCWKILHEVLFGNFFVAGGRFFELIWGTKCEDKRQFWIFKSFNIHIIEFFLKKKFIKYTAVKCSTSGKTCKNFFCKLKAVSRNDSFFSFNCDLKRPLTQVIVNILFFYFS